MSNSGKSDSLDSEAEAEVISVFSEMGLNNASNPKLTDAMFGTTRKRSFTKLNGPSKRDSGTLPFPAPSSSRSSEQSSPSPPSRSFASPIKRADSPDIETILKHTPRPRKSSSAFGSPSLSSRKSTTSLQKSIKSSELSDDPSLLDDLEEDDGSETDSSLDIHTPLPQVMFRDGVLSPRSKLLPQGSPFGPYSNMDEHDRRAGSVLSIASTAESVVTKSGLQRDPRDTERRRVRHRDGRLLRAGMGLTTGLGWSDSEDEDAPSSLTRKLIHTTVERKRSGSMNISPRSSVQYPEGRLSRVTSSASITPSLASRKQMSYSSLRSASISLPLNTSIPESPIPVSRVASPSSNSASRARAASASTGNSIVQRRNVTSPPLSKAVSSPSPEPVPRTPKARMGVSKGRTPSVTSTSSVVQPRVPRLSAFHSPSNSVSTPPLVPRARAGSSASTTSTATTSAASVSVYSQDSQHSSASTVSSTSTQVSGAPRPLRLPQTARARPMNRSVSTNAQTTALGGSRASVASSSFTTSSVDYQRARNPSNPQYGSTSTFASTLPRPGQTTPSSFAQGPRSGVLPPGSPPTLRERPSQLNGSRQRPRTGTGMVYKTSSPYTYASFHESAVRVQGVGLSAGAGGIGLGLGSPKSPNEGGSRVNYF